MRECECASVCVYIYSNTELICIYACLYVGMFVCMYM